MSGRDGPAHLDLLEKQSEEIVKELGETPKWRKYPNPDRNLNIVYVDKINVDVTDTTDWHNQHAWLASKLEKFNEVFRPRIMTLSAADYAPASESNSMKKVTLYLSDKLGDPETGKRLQMCGVELKGTSTQIGLIWECLRRFGEIDVTHHSELEILRKCEVDLKRARETANAFELNDPDQE